ncbi:MAG: hypothetical protein JXA30_06670 [Deltaproteobacteria bacterium]|nr:hypothetical protein [Deltaproteobacteria bacterium]
MPRCTNFSAKKNEVINKQAGTIAAWRWPTAALARWMHVWLKSERDKEPDCSASSFKAVKNAG